MQVLYSTGHCRPMGRLMYLVMCDPVLVIIIIATRLKNTIRVLNFMVSTHLQYCSSVMSQSNGSNVLKITNLEAWDPFVCEYPPFSMH